MLLCLPALLATQDDPARDALKRIDEVLGKAKTVTILSRTEAKSGGDSVIVTTTVLLKQDRVSISGYRGARDVELAPGAVCVLVGESSSGKSTVLSAIWALLEAAAPMPTAADVSHGHRRVHVEAVVGML